MSTRATPEQLKARLGLRSSSAAQKHENEARTVKRPGHGNRRKQQQTSIQEQGK